MGKLAFLFAGQGAQQPGMGLTLRQLPGAKEVFDTAETLRPGTMDDCFESTPARLAVTAVTQPCVYTVGLAAAKALEARGIKPEAVAGFSLGEMAALTFARAFPEEEGFHLVCRRGELMQQAAKKYPGSMAAVLKLDDKAVEKICGDFEGFYPVNYNCPGQLVVAGRADRLTEFELAVRQAGGLARRLAVSGAFHSPYMRTASEEFAAVLDENGMAEPLLPVYANLTAQPYAEPLRTTLAAQIKSPVRWTATMAHLAAEGFDTFVEVGPGKTLTGLAKRIVPGATLLNVQDAESLEQTVAALG